MILTCGGCETTWTGSTRAHCAACHRTFGGVGGFDAHRVNGTCVEPATRGMKLTDAELWVRQTDREWPQ